MDKAFSLTDNAVRTLAPAELDKSGKHGLAGLLRSLDPITSVETSKAARAAIYAVWCEFNTETIFQAYSANICARAGLPFAAAAVRHAKLCEVAAGKDVSYR